MLRYKALLKNEALAILMQVGIFLSIYCFLRFFNEGQGYNVSFHFGLIVGALLPMTSLVGGLRDKFAQMLPVSAKTKYIYMLTCSTIRALLIMVLPVTSEIFLFDGNSAAIEILTGIKYWLLIAFFISISATGAILFRSTVFQTLYMIITVIGAVFALLGVYEGDHLNHVAIHILILLLTVVFTVVNYQIYKRWQPANNGILLL